MGAGASTTPKKSKSGSITLEDGGVAAKLAKLQHAGHIRNGETKVLELMQHMTIAELPSNNLVVLEGGSPATASVEQMLAQGACSAPVIGAAADSADGKKDIVGVVDMADVGSGIVSHTERVNASAAAAAKGSAVAAAGGSAAAGKMDLAAVAPGDTSNLMSLSRTDKEFRAVESNAAVLEVRISPDVPSIRASMCGNREAGLQPARVREGSQGQD